MKTAPKSVLLLFVLLLAAGCFRNDIRTATFRIEALRTTGDAETLERTLQQIAGFKECKPDFENRTLTVVFDGRAAGLKNFEYAIVSAGYSLPNWPAEP
ncbi:MAG: hypothetical protein PWQ29_1113 [Verrucomicrobiota bacterium]|jgi:copper chaperone CopZ|nr:hypothetical protein [Verrucomicrobiota bacterium]MDK2963719.1 hypothetical protein [Verrucomicrobiota bacterium]